MVCSRVLPATPRFPSSAPTQTACESTREIWVSLAAPENKPSVMGLGGSGSFFCAKGSEKKLTWPSEKAISPRSASSDRAHQDTTGAGLLEPSTREVSSGYVRKPRGDPPDR